MTNTNSDEDGKRLLVAIGITLLAVIALLLPTPANQTPTEEPVSLIHIAYADELEPRVVLIATTTQEQKEIPALRPELEVICGCESAGFEHRNPDGTLLSGFIDNDDKGECQINTRYHGDTMERMGLDINDDHDYRTYANHLYDTQGKQPWSASAACWAPIIGY
jgi:exonuclease I